MGQCMQDYKCLCTAVTIGATLFVPKFDLSILTPVTSKSTSNPRRLLHLCQIHLSCKFVDRTHRRSVACKDNIYRYKYFCDDLKTE